MGTESFAEVLRGFRTRAGLTQGLLAERAGLSEQAISMLERGSRRRPRAYTIDALIDALELSPVEAQYLRDVSRGARQAPTGSRPPPATHLAPEVPRQLPPTLPDFTGRQTELASLLKILMPSEPVNAVGLAAVTGMGGVGKTSLAIHAAHLAAEAYPDGHLYLDLRGYGPGEPVRPIDALSQLLRSLGVDGGSIPARVDEAAALYRSRLAGLRVLILLDNANGAAQVRPLVPGVPGSAVIMTSRRGLTALAGVQHVSLAPLPELDAVELLSRIVGDTRVAAEDTAARSVAGLIGHLPLAVRLVGARLAARPTWPLDYMVGQLRNERRRLDELGTGDSGVRANIAGSVQFLANSDHELDRRAAAALPYLGLPEGADLGTTTVARLIDRPEAETEQMLERLVDLNLLECTAPARYRLHDLIRTYARERAYDELSPEARTNALARLLRLYTAAAWRCHELTHQQSRRLVLATVAQPPEVHLADEVAALEWLDAERPNISRSVEQANRDPELRHHVPELVMALFGYYEPRCRWGEMRSLNLMARTVADSLDLHRLAAWLEHDLAIPEAEQDRFDAARHHLLTSLEMFRAIGDEAGQARCCSSLSHVSERLGRPDDALDWAEQSLTLSRRIGDETVEGVTYLALAGLHIRRGDFARATHYFDLSIGLAHRAGNLRSLAKRYQNIALAYQEAGLLDAAATAFTTALETFTRIGDLGNHSQIRFGLAEITLATGRLDLARTQAELGIQEARAHGNTRREGLLWTVLGKVQAAQGDVSAARTSWRRAASLLNQQSPKDEAAALELLAGSDQTTR